MTSEDLWDGGPLGCVRNLLAITRGEVPLNRAMGLPPELVDTPIGPGTPQVGVAVATVVNRWEPRVDADVVGSCRHHWGNG